MVHGLSCSAACGIFPDQGSNPSPLHGRRILNHCASREAPGPTLIVVGVIKLQGLGGGSGFRGKREKGSGRIPGAVVTQHPSSFFC